MIEISEIKELMRVRAAVASVLAKIMTEPPKTKDIHDLCKFLFGLNEAVEAVDENDELMSGYNDLKNWYEKACDIGTRIVDAKLYEEFGLLFKKHGTGMSINFPEDSVIFEAYKLNGYTPKEGLAPSNLGQMLYFLSFMADKTESINDLEEIKRSARLQRAFVENHIMPLLSDFCAILYERSVSYGVYRYMAVILHGYLNLDSASMQYFG